MAEAQPTADPFSLQSRIERSQQRVVRQRAIVEDLLKYNIAGPAQRVLDLMEQALAELREEYDREQQLRQQQAPAPVAEPAAEAAPPQPEMATAE
jgi:hypothetical protein